MSYGAPNPALVEPEICLHDAQTVRMYEPAKRGTEIASLFAHNPGRFWLHLDLDVLDQAVMPAVDYLMPNGLEWDEVTALIRPLAASQALIGADMTILNPTLDPGGA